MPKNQDAEQPVYKKAVKELLIRKGLPDVKVNITRLWRVDLEGDGTEEVLINAITDRKGYGEELVGARKGDYSMVLLRRVVKGNAVTIPIVLNYHIANAVEGSGPTERYTLEAVLDVNGDGVLEVITGYHAAVWDGKTVYSVIGNTVKARMSSYSGA